MRLEEIGEGQGVLERNGVEVESVEEVGAEGVELSVRGSGGSEATVLFSGGIGGGQARVLEGLLRERPDARYFDLRTPGRVVVGPAPNRGVGESARGSG
jgi:cell division protein FtsQ